MSLRLVRSPLAPKMTAAHGGVLRLKRSGSCSDGSADIRNTLAKLDENSETAGAAGSCLFALVCNRYSFSNREGRRPRPSAPPFIKWSAPLPDKPSDRGQFG